MLKVILNQHGLDKPFTGGLGSFKLYVLVANHVSGAYTCELDKATLTLLLMFSLSIIFLKFNEKIERHLALGGSDDPAEILLMFLFRYGQVPGYSHVAASARTCLTQLMVIESGDGEASADMGGVHQVENCIKVFQACFFRLRDKLSQRTNPDHSILTHIIDARKLELKRRQCCLKASLVAKYKRQNHSSMESKSTQKEGTRKCFENNLMTSSSQYHQEEDVTLLDTDDEAEQLMAGYNVMVAKTENKNKKKRGSTKKARWDFSERKRRKVERRQSAESKRRATL